MESMHEKREDEKGFIGHGLLVWFSKSCWQFQWCRPRSRDLLTSHLWRVEVQEREEGGNRRKTRGIEG